MTRVAALALSMDRSVRGETPLQRRYRETHAQLQAEVAALQSKRKPTSKRARKQARSELWRLAGQSGAET